ncbi:hypothetical protein BCR42DRAFT_452869 [Absidia repens]|uniref:C2H2-type domain-containing protein n=1 Tax=Absidia repens TaxID=90262 RepID=A0A1X2IBU0_9FUNG|nr:hypothetical protein BCR42DRAFT_452869 [Absidia repens]
MTPHSRQLPTPLYTSPARSSNILDTPQSIDSAPHSNDAIHSQEPYPWGEYNHQWDQPIYYNDDHELAFACNPEHALIAPLTVDPTELLPHAPSEFECIPAGVPETDHAMLKFFSGQASTAMDKENLEKLLLNDLPAIMDMSVPECGDLCFPQNNIPSNHQSPSPQTQQPHSPSPSSTQNTSPFSPISVIINGTDPDRSYVCGSCHKKYTRPQDCTRHIKSAHIKTKRFVCHQAGCIGRYCRSDVLKRHLRIVHQKSNV